MGFNKRYVKKKTTLKHLKSDTLSQLYDKVDLFIFLDEFSVKVKELYVNGLSNQEIIVNIEELIEN
jgi:hypothetical protein